MTLSSMKPVDYPAAARRHFDDAQLLLEHGRAANAGQLFGFTMECGLKALLVICGVIPDETGSVPAKGKFRKHMPDLFDNIAAFGNLIPDGQMAQTYLANIPGQQHFKDWSVDHRYCREAAIPLGSLPLWQAAATEINAMLDQAKTDGVL